MITNWQQFILKMVQLRGKSANQKFRKVQIYHPIPTFCEKCWVAGISNMNYKQGFCTNAEVFIMDEGIEMLPIEERNEKTSSEPQLPWWVSQVDGR